jgi:hypothetical protein
MKGVFNRGAFLLALSVLGPGLAASGHAQVYYSVRGLLSEQFRDSQLVELQRVQITAERRDAIEQRLGRKLEKEEDVFYVVRTAERVDGCALFDREIGRHEYIDFASFFDDAGRVTRIEVVAYREPYGGGIRSKRFRKQFVGKEAGSRFRPGHDTGEADPIAEPDIDSGPALVLPPDGEELAAFQPMPRRKLLEIPHFHLFTMPLYLLILSHMYLLSRSRKGPKTVWIGVGSFATLLHIAAP